MGLDIDRYFTKNLNDPFAHFDYGCRVVFIESDQAPIEVEVPKHWSDNAAYILARHYLANIKEGDITVSENSIRQVVGRMADGWMQWGLNHNYFAAPEDAHAFRDEVIYMMLAQMAAPNSPQWFNTGIHQAYGIKGADHGHFYVNPNTGTAERCENSYEHPQVHACFIQSVKDNLVGPEGIMDLWMREARVFKFGSGTGSNFSALRGKNEPLESGGTSSGVVSFLKVGDAAAGAIRSGGSTRRAAKMVCLDVDHPDIEEFISWKANEESKAQLMIQSGLDAQDAYETVSGQNSNNSIRVSDAFMQTLRRSGQWNLKNRSIESVKESVSAKSLWEQMSKAAWMCGDPGIQFDSTINKWNTCKTSGMIHASNPCSEYMFLNDTACNLASINLNRFRDEQNRFDSKSFLHATRLWTIVLDISVLMGQFPSKEVAEQTWRFRTLGLGFTGLGAMLMSMGLAYDSEESRHLATAIAASMTGQAYLTSSEMAKNLGAFNGFELNKSSMLEVMVMHRDALSIATKTKSNSHLLEAAARIWDQVINLGSKSGFRNAQVSCIAPTGTIGLLMDSDTTGIEPLFAPVAFKHLSDGGTMQQSAACVEAGLVALKFSKPSIAKQIGYLKKHGVMDINQFSNPQHISVFQCATGSDLGLSPIAVSGHLLMMAAVQPFLSGAISKTVNLNHQATVEQVADCFLKSHRLGLKSIAVYREGSKRIQPLSQANDSSGYAIEDEGCCSIPVQNKKMSTRHSILL